MFGLLPKVDVLGMVSSEDFLTMGWIDDSELFFRKKLGRSKSQTKRYLFK